MMGITFLVAIAYQAIFSADVPDRLVAKVPPSEGTLAIVNGVAIRRSDLEPFLWDWRGKDALQDLISYQIAKSAATVAAVSVSEDEVQARLDEILSQLKAGLTAGRTLTDVFAEEGSSPSRLYIRIRTELLLNKVVLKDFVPADYTKISTIVVRLKDESAEALKQGLHTADLAYAEATTGKGWEQAVKRFTEDPEATQNNGLVGWRHKDAFPEAVQKQLETLPVAGVTKPVQTKSGLQIFRIEEKGKSAPPLALKELQNVYIMSARAQLVKKLRAEAKIDRPWGT